ncbi:MAG: oxygen-independent coproporphyrinogen III oxidase [Brevundimonas sp.]|uniref:oxygen-independent coproporphyrinogen III oxidase n=1 Tax=Brevundimonas sp. TaxID=1871086 RepID=UPI001211D31A|nr:oxygen-independent coproporphyrinogen III oxidase [Brevundimonas sp.]RZJ19571.1 MAG: oxygen-independent coproporphyrinogen III oxidase [Brevundimonas sp.]
MPTSDPDGADVAALIARHDANVPRYTSYPTAAQFTPAVGPATWTGWMAEAPLDRPVSLYVHLPFCKRLCWYCGCNTRAVNRAQTISDYVELLAKEAAMVANVAGRRLGIGSLHLGGGTPNMLSPADLDRLFGALGQAFDMGAVDQIAAELDPAVLTRDWVRAAARHGLNRASLGVQDLSPQVQQAVNRIEPFVVIEQATGWLREAGVGSVNLDLMYGLPRQGVDQVLATLEQILTLRPERIALFGYAHVPWMKPHQKLINEAELPGAEARFEQSRAASDRLVAAGYQAIGLDHFALPDDPLAVAAREGRMRRNFQGYVVDEAPVLIGLGASSIGQTPGGYVQNITVERDWREAVSEGRLPIARGVALSDEDRFRGELIERLMCDFAVDLDAVCARHGRTPSDLAEALARLAPVQADGLLVHEGARIRMTEAGKPFVRVACAAFDTTLRPSAARHARAV